MNGDHKQDVDPKVDLGQRVHGIVTTPGLNVHHEPSMHSKVFDVLARGNRVQILRIDTRYGTESEWYLVRYNHPNSLSKQGWVSTVGLKIETPPEPGLPPFPDYAPLDTLRPPFHRNWIELAFTAAVIAVVGFTLAYFLGGG